jgi:DNA-binding MarR family transcriptional regulator
MSHTKSVKISDYQSLAEFRYQMRRFLHFSQASARDAGIEPQQHQLMLAVKGAPDGEEPRIAYLAERLQIQHHSAVELVDRMVKKDLITRTRGENDRREVYVQLTDLGDGLLSQLTQHMRAELRSAAPALVATLHKLTPRPTAVKKARRQTRLAKAGAA